MWVKILAATSLFKMNKEYRVYTSQNDGLKSLRFSGRHLSGFPKNLEIMIDYEWQECKNINYSIRIQKEKLCERHNWSRYTISQWFCYDCGIVENVEKIHKSIS